MTALPKRRKKHNSSLRANKDAQRKSNLIAVILALIVLFETIIILSLITKPVTTKSVKKPTRVVTKKAVSAAPKIAPIIKYRTRVSAEPRITPATIKGKIAIVIDDWGYNKYNLHILSEIDFPLTLAILPFQNYSRQVAEFGYDHNFEIIIHMPMEPEEKENVGLEPNTLMVHMSRNTIDTILNKAFAEIKYAKGMNNHMGSLATQNKSFMTKVFRNLKENKAYFLDSHVIADTVVAQVSKEVGIKFAQRSVFLDNELGPEQIRNQLDELIQEAEKYGKAVGIGHDRARTLLILKEELPKLARRGYKFVYLSDIVE